MTLEHVYLPDSWVLSVETDDSHVCFLLDAVLQPEHPRYYWPPKPGEQYAYARIRWSWTGVAHWNSGPHLDRPAVDANGEHDFGSIDSWIGTGDSDHIEGEFGAVLITRGRQTIEYLDP